ncbi:MAG: sigma-70 family RNA polymerase sigma factor [Gammaproteobacteria bacterium]
MAKPPEEPELASLLASIAAGSQSALERFYSVFQNRVYSYALARLRDPHLAAEVVNEVMMEVWRSAERFEGRSRVQTWLLGIAHHKVIDRFRRKPAPELVELDDRLPDESDVGVERLLAGIEETERLQVCLDRLSDEHRLVMHLAFVEDLSYAEIAEVAEIPLGTVKTRVFHARKLLKRCLGAG